MEKGSTQRNADYPILPAILDRWSPRSMSRDAIDETDLMKLFEAARWAPSSFNAQPWRFIYATRESEAWPTFLDLLVEANQAWAVNAAALIVVISETTNAVTGKDSVTHSLDTGLACENFALQGFADGLVVHMMQGFDTDAAREKLDIPPEYKVEIMIAVGRPGAVDQLPEKMRKREKPSDRLPLSTLVFERAYQKD